MTPPKLPKIYMYRETIICMFALDVCHMQVNLGEDMSLSSNMYFLIKACEFLFLDTSTIYLAWKTFRFLGNRPSFR